MAVLEGDVSYVSKTCPWSGICQITTVYIFRDVCLVNILVPAVQVINKILSNFYDARNVPSDERKIVTIRAQYKPLNAGDEVSKYSKHRVFDLRLISATL